MAGKILVVGATGPTGRLVIERLLQAEQPILAMSRTPSKAPQSWGTQVEVVQGDLRDTRSLETVLDEPVSAIIMCSGTRNLFGFGDNTGREMEIGGMENLLKSLRGQRPRFAYVSTILVTRRRSNPFGWMLNTVRGGVLEHKFQAEEALRKSGLDYLILRPGGLTHGPSKRARYLFDQGDKIMGQVSRADVAEVLVGWVLNDLPSGITCEFITENREAFQPNWAQHYGKLTTDD